MHLWLGHPHSQASVQSIAQAFCSLLFPTSLKQSYVVLPLVNVEIQSFCTLSIYRHKRSLFNKLDMNEP